MLNSTIVANISGALPANQKISSGLHSSLLMPVSFTMTEVKTNVPHSEQRKFFQKSAGKGSSNAIYNGQRKANNYLDHNKNQQVKLQMMNGNKNGIDASDEGIPLPKICLYSGKINPEWQKVHKIGAGLINLGNTCFMNTVLQCLTYTPPLANYLLHDSDHASKCKLSGFCMMCELQQHMKKTIDRPGDVVKPVHIYQKLKSIAKHFQFGRQEDAHEFLRYVIDNLWKSCLSNYDGHTKLDPASKETTVINQIFGGYHRSQVTCLRCREKSNTYDHFMDFILDVKQNVISLEKALEKFIQPELLQNDNAYKCPQCKMKVSAQKKFSVYKAPNVATFQFKRFDYHRMCGGKITKHIAYPENLNLRPYMSVSKGGPVWYRLNAVLVHLGATCNSGHYFCYVRNSNGFWYVMDDARVQQVSLNQVLNQIAYVLFYVRVNPSENLTAKRQAEHSASAVKNNHLVKNGFVDRTNCAASPNLIPRPSLSFKASPLPGISKLSVSQQASGLCNGTSSSAFPKQVLQPLSQNREKIAFSVVSQNNASKLIGKAQQKVESSRAANISPLSKNMLNGNLLVPYIEDSSDSSDDSKTDNPCGEEPKTSCGLSPYISKANSTVSQSASTNKHLAYSLKQPVPPSEESNSSIIIESKAKSRCTSNLRQSFNYNSFCRGTRSPSVEKNMTQQNSNNMLETSLRKHGTVSSMTSKTLENSANEKATIVQETMSLGCGTKTSGGTPLLNNSLDFGAALVLTPSKVNATTQWSVTDASLQSPSIASGSSTNSVNSTTDWNVIDQESGSRRKMDRNSLAWSVQIRSIDRAHKGYKSESSSRVQLPRTSPASVETCVKNRIHEMCDSINDLSSAAVLDCEVHKSPVCEAAASAPKAIDSPSCTLLPAVEAAETKNATGRSRSVSLSSKENVCRVNVKQELSSEKPSDGQVPSLGKSNFRDQPFHFSHTDSFLENSCGAKSGQQQGHCEAKEQTSHKRTFSDAVENASEKWPTRFLDVHENSCSQMPKKFKANNNSIKSEGKHATLKSSECKADVSDITKFSTKASADSNASAISRTNSNVNLVDVRNKADSVPRDETSKHTKAHCWDKNKKVPAETDQRTRKVQKNDSDSESMRSDKSNGRVSSLSNSSVEYEWVEKTKETLSASKATSLNVQDQDMKNNYKKQNNKEARHSSAGDYGYSSRNKGFDFQRNSSSYIFGSDVGTWDNSSRSENRVSESQHKLYFDEYDDELDRGKVRQKRRYNHNNYYKHNPFQEFQTGRSKMQFHNAIAYKPFGQTNGYRSFYRSGIQDVFCWGPWKPKTHSNRSYSHKDRYFNRRRKSSFKHFSRTHDKDHRHNRSH